MKISDGKIAVKSMIAEELEQKILRPARSNVSSIVADKPAPVKKGADSNPLPVFVDAHPPNLPNSSR
jgi:hypothetical protein